jgi:surface polysaccharide O-acyltransferase-like enzyme
MDHWTTVGPFHFQTSRVLLYLVYFLMGTAVSVYGLEKTMFNPKSTLTRHWGGWIGAGLMSLVVYVVILVGILTGLIGPSGMFFYGLAFTVTCAAVVFGVIAFFLRFMKRRVGIIDSLSNNAFGIYITHYLFMTWLQFWLLGAQLPVILKSSIVFLGTLILSWGFTAVIRRNKIVARVI